MKTTVDDYRPAPDDTGLPLFAAARRNDPPTSHAAGRNAEESGLIERHERIILEALAVGPGSKDEIALRCGLTEQQVIRRRAGLLRKGLVELTGDVRRTAGGQRSGVWRLT